MLRNYFTVSFRNLLRHRGYSAINITGLAVGLSCFLLIVMMVMDELSFDRFNERADSIYRVTLDARVGDKEFITARSSGPLASSLRANIPGVETAARIRVIGDHSARFGDKSFTEYRLYVADSTIFNVFSFSVVEGDRRTFLTQPNTTVITDQTARKYFGEAPALGKTIVIDGKFPYMVCGVVKPFPNRSHWHFNWLFSSGSSSFGDGDAENWVGNNWYTYVLLKEGVLPAEPENAFKPIVVEHVRPILKETFGADWASMEARGMYYRYRFQPLKDIHLYSRLDEELEPTGTITSVTMFILIAVFILLIACINFMNLNTARSAHRAKEVGVRKVLGSDRSQLIRMFLSEAVLLSLLALILSIGIVELVLPWFNTFIGKELSFLGLGPLTLAVGGVFLVLLVGLMAGSYPAFVLSSFQPARVLKGEIRSGMRSGRLRSFLVVAQFSISIALMVGTIVVYQQLRFVQFKDLGFDKDHMLVVDNTKWLPEERTRSFREMLLTRPGILAAAYTQELPGNDIGSAAYRPEGGDRGNLMMFRQLSTDFEYLQTIGVTLRDGRYFSRQFATDATDAAILNGSAAKLLGYEHPVGRTVIGYFHEGERPFKIIGVTEDFHYEPLHLPILPMVILISHGNPTRIVLRVHGNIPEIVNDVRQQWASFSGGQPFTCFFLDERIERYYRHDQAVSTLFGIFASLGIFISCLGLLGLAMYATEQRTKELGVRKVFGASVMSLTGLLTQEFVKLVLIANVIAWPVAYLAMQRWLDSFAYRITQGIGAFVLAGAAALLIALATVAYNTIRAAKANPIQSLRYE